MRTKDTVYLLKTIRAYLQRIEDGENVIVTDKTEANPPYSYTAEAFAHMIISQIDEEFFILQLQERQMKDEARERALKQRYLKYGGNDL